MDPRVKKLLANNNFDNIIKIAEEWTHLSVEDLQELIGYSATRVWCVYDNWADLAKSIINIDSNNKDIPEYLISCIDIDKLISYLKQNNDEQGYIELASGKILKIEQE